MTLLKIFGYKCFFMEHSNEMVSISFSKFILVVLKQDNMFLSPRQIVKDL